jgi:Leucine-rich repeat (LRR) protein
VLNLSNNSLSAIDPSVFAQTKQLQEINLSHNDFSKLSAELIEALSSVEIMRLENNKIFTIDNGNIKTDYNLRQLFMKENQFTVITAAMLEKFVKL